MKPLFILLSLVWSSGEDGLTAPEKEKIVQMLQQYDQGWNQNELSKLTELFQQDSPNLSHLLIEGKEFLEGNRVLSCKTEILQIEKRSGQLGVYTRSQMTFAPKSTLKVQFTRLFQMDHLLLLHPEKDGFRIFRLEDFDDEFVPYLNSTRLGCPACNFEITRPANWFLLPRHQGWAACTESISFLHPSGMLSADFDVSESVSDLDPEKVFERDHCHMIQACRLNIENCSCQPGKKVDVGPNHQGYEVEGSFVQGKASNSPTKMRFLRFYIVKGPILYSLHIYGKSELFDSARADIDALKTSLKMINPAVTLSSLKETMRSRHNPGGAWDHNNYSNRQYSVRLQGPTDWKPEDLSGPTLFHIRYTQPQNPEVRLNFHAIQDPNGWPDEDSITYLISSREEKLKSCRESTAKRLSTVASTHKGLQTNTYQVEWMWQSEKPTREQVAYFPAGSILYILEFSAPAPLFEKYFPVYQSVFDSLSRF